MMKKHNRSTMIPFCIITLLSAVVLSSCTNNINGFELTAPSELPNQDFPQSPQVPPQTPPFSPPPFNENGLFNDAVRDVHIRDDDKIIVGGEFTQYGPVSVGRFVRLNADGSLDNSCQFSKFNNTVMKVLELSDQSVIAVGRFTQYGTQPAKNIAKLKSDCTLDTSFHNQPILDSYPFNIVQQGDKFLVGGYFSSYDGMNQGGLVRLLSNGMVDTSFNTMGNGFDGGVFALHVQDDLSILVGHGGTFYNSTMHGYLLKLDPNGNVDQTFYSGQDATSGRRGLTSSVVDIIEVPCSDTPPVNSTGYPPSSPCTSIIAVGALQGYIDSQSNVTFLDGIASINSDGSIDNNFHVGYDGNIGTGYQIRYQEQNDKLIMLGAIEEVYGVPTHGIARFHRNGQLDYSFYTLFNSGFTNHSNNASMTTYALEFQSDGKMIVGGRFTHYDGQEAYNLVRLDQDGYIDPTFGQ